MPPVQPPPETLLAAYQEWAKEFLAYGCHPYVGMIRYAWFLAEQVRAGKIEHLPALKDMALKLARRHHRVVAPLFQSQHGKIAWGRGGQQEEDWHKYSKAYHKAHGPARWKNGGVRLDSETQPTAIILENHRGKEVCRIDLTE